MLGGALALAGCASGGGAVAVGGPLSGELSAASRVDQVVVVSGPVEPAAFAEAARAALAVCATGAKPLRLEATLTRADGSGTARFVDPATGATVGVYAVASGGADPGRAFGEDL